MPTTDYVPQPAAADQPRFLKLGWRWLHSISVRPFYSFVGVCYFAKARRQNQVIALIKEDLFPTPLGRIEPLVFQYVLYTYCITSFQNVTGIRANSA
jgi:hypothetical protein